MSTRVYGSWVTLVKNIKIRAFLDYTVTNDNTTTTLTYHNGYQVQTTKRTGSTKHTVKYPNASMTSHYSDNTTFTGTYAGRSFTDSQTKTYTYGPYGPRTKTFTRTHNAQTGYCEQVVRARVVVESINSGNGLSSSIVGWEQFNVKVSFSIPAKPSYKITYNANGGTGTGSQTKWYGESLTLLNGIQFTWDKHTLLKYNTNASGTGTNYNLSSSYTNNSALTLYAQWYPDDAITYNANGGSAAPSTQYKPYNQNITISTQIPTRTGYTFKGWTTAQNSLQIAYNPGDIYSTNTSITLYAIWEANSKTCTLYELNNGEYVSSIKEIPKSNGAYISQTSVPDKYEFLGWVTTEPNNPIYPFTTTLDDLGGTLYIGQRPETVFYAVYADRTQTEFQIISSNYCRPLTSNETVVNDFEDYINIIESGQQYSNIDNTDEGHAIFGYVQFNNSLKNIQITETSIYEMLNDTTISSNMNLYTYGAEPSEYVASHLKALGVNCVLNSTTQYTSPNTNSSYYTTTTNGGYEWCTHTLNANIDNITGPIKFTVSYSPLAQTWQGAVDSTDGASTTISILSYICKVTVEVSNNVVNLIFTITGRQIPLSLITNVYNDKIYYYIYNEYISINKKYKITISALDEYQKLIQFVTLIKIKIPIIDITLNDTEAGGNIKINDRLEIIPESNNSTLIKGDTIKLQGNKLLYANQLTLGNPPELSTTDYGDTAPIGTHEVVYLTSALSIPSGNWTRALTIKLGSGIWLIVAGARFQETSNSINKGTRQVGFVQLNGGAATHATAYPAASANSYTQLVLPRIVYNGYSVTWELELYQGSGTSITTSTSSGNNQHGPYGTYISAIKLANWSWS